MRRVLLLALLVLLPACARRGDPVRGLLDAAAKDAEGRDASALAARLTSDFRAAGGEGRAETEQMLKGLFFGYESLSVTLSDVTIERSPEVARVTFRADLAGTPRGGGLAAILPRSATYRFDFRVVREGENWKVAEAAWRPLSGDGS